MERYRWSLRVLALCGVFANACASTTYPNLSARVSMTRELRPDRRLQATLCADLAQGEAASRARYGRASWWLAGGATAGAIVTAAAVADDQETIAWGAGIGTSLLLIGSIINLGLHLAEDDGRQRAQHSLDLVQASLNEAKRDRLSQALRELESELAAHGMSPTTLDVTATNLRADLAKHEEALETTASSVVTTESEIGALKAEIVKREMDVSQLRSTKKSKARDAAIATIERAIEEAKFGIRGLDQRLADLRSAEAQLEHDIARRREALAQTLSLASRYVAATQDLRALGDPTSSAASAYAACVGREAN